MPVQPTPRTPRSDRSLRRWRQSRGLSQEKLADQAEVSPRHLSFLENGRSAPSREMVLALAGTLDLPLRDQNALLGSAGFSAQPSPRAALESRELSMVRRALDCLLAKQEPYPAIVVDPAWNVSRMNHGAQRLFAWALAGRQPPPEVLANAMRATLHPEGLRHVIVGWPSWPARSSPAPGATSTIAPTRASRRVLREVLDYPDVPRGRLAEHRAARTLPGGARAPRRHRPALLHHPDHAGHAARRHRPGGAHRVVLPGRRGDRSTFVQAIAEQS